MTVYQNLASIAKDRISVPSVKDLLEHCLKLAQSILNRLGMPEKSHALSYLSGNRLYEERRASIGAFAALAQAQRKRLEVHESSRKIQCCVLAYYDLETIRKSIDFLCDRNDRLEITVIENRSKHTDDKIKPYVLDKLEAGKIVKYVLLDKNIAGNALKVYTDYVYQDDGSPYFLLTDGDLTVADPAWLDEELAILERHDETFVCSLDLDLSNLPVQSFPEAHSWITQPADRGAYLEGFSGAYLLLFKKEFFLDSLAYIRKNNMVFLDASLHKYALQHGLAWARTKKAKAHHITWDLYMDLNHEYTRLKTSATYDELWTNNNVCGFTVYEKDKVTHHEPAGD